MRNPVPYRVECMSPPCRAYAVIAAFDIDVIAKRYMRECSKSKMSGSAYRVTYRGKVIATDE